MHTKGFSKVALGFLIGLSIALFFIYVAGAVVTGVEYNNETRTVLIKAFGANVSELQLIDTQQSIGMFKASYRFKPYASFSLTGRNSLYNVTVTKFIGDGAEISRFTIEERYNITVAVTSAVCNPFVAPNLSAYDNCTSINNGTQNIEFGREIPFDMFNYNYTAGRNYYFTMYATKPPSTGRTSFDISPKIEGYDLFPYFVWWNTSYDNCANINVSVSGFTYTTNNTPIIRWINTSSLAVIPYNESVRISNMPCDQGGVEIPSAFAPWQQNASGHVLYARLAIIPNGTVGSNIVYGMYYNYTTVGRFDYTTDLKVTATNITNTWYTISYTSGASDQQQYLGNSDTGNDGAGGNAVLGLARNGANILTAAQGSCSIGYNFSIMARMDCSVTEGGQLSTMYHWHPAYSTIQQLQKRTVWVTSMYEFGTPNNTAGSYTIAPFNVTGTGDNAQFNLTRGICGTWLNASATGRFFVWNSTLNQTKTRWSVNSFAGCQMAGDSGSTTDVSDNMSMITHGYMTGSTSAIKIDNMTNYWGLYAASPHQDEILVNPTIQNIAPTITVLDPTNRTIPLRNASLNVTATIVIDRWWYILGSGANTTFTPNATILAVSGTNNITVYANGTTGLVGSTAINFTVNALPTLFGLTIIPNPAYVNSVMNVSVLYNDSEGSSGTVVFRWMQNGINVQNNTFGGIANNTNVTAIDAFTLGRFDNISVLVQANDSSPLVNASTSNLTLSSSFVFRSTVQNRVYFRNSQNLTINLTITNDSGLSLNTLRLEFNNTNFTMTRYNSTMYAFSLNLSQRNLSDGNMTIRFFADDSVGNETNTSVYASLIIDNTLPTVAFSRTPSMDGVLRGRQINMTLNFSELYIANWTLYIYNTSGTLDVSFNGTANATFFMYNSTTVQTAGNWTANLTAEDLAGNLAATASQWFGIGNVVVTTVFNYTAGNFTNSTNAWGSSSAISNNTAITFDYIIYSHINLTGFCANCSMTVEKNLSRNFTGLFSVTSLLNNASSSLNYTMTNDTINFTYWFNNTNAESQFSAMRITVPNALLYRLDADALGVLWYVIQVRNVTNDTSVSTVYARTTTTTAHTFNAQSEHPRINYCISGLDALVQPASCTTLSTTIDILDNNNGNNAINFLFDGPSTAVNIRRFYANFSSFAFRETIEGGSTTQAGGTSGGGGGGSIGRTGKIPLPGEIICDITEEQYFNATTNTTTCRKISPCPPGFHLEFSAEFNGDVCQVDKLPLPPISESRTALVTILIIGGGIAYILTMEGRHKRQKEAKRRSDMFG